MNQVVTAGLHIRRFVCVVKGKKPEVTHRNSPTVRRQMNVSANATSKTTMLLVFPMADVGSTAVGTSWRRPSGGKMDFQCENLIHFSRDVPVLS